MQCQSCLFLSRCPEQAFGHWDQEIEDLGDPVQEFEELDDAIASGDRGGADCNHKAHQSMMDENKVH